MRTFARFRDLRLRWKIQLAPAILIAVLLGLGSYAVQTLRVAIRDDPADHHRHLSRVHAVGSHPVEHLRHQQGMAALDKVGLADWSHHNPNELSGGQQQRVAIARALVTQPDVLLADEPTGNLDSERSIEIMELLAQLNAQAGLTVLLVTHEQEMAAFARKIVHFKDGLVDSVEARA